MTIDANLLLGFLVGVAWGTAQTVLCVVYMVKRFGKQVHK